VMYPVIPSALLAFLEAKRRPLKPGYSVGCLSDGAVDFARPGRKAMNK